MSSGEAGEFGGVVGHGNLVGRTREKAPCKRISDSNEARCLMLEAD